MNLNEISRGVRDVKDTFHRGVFSVTTQLKASSQRSNKYTCTITGFERNKQAFQFTAKTKKWDDLLSARPIHRSVLLQNYSQGAKFQSLQRRHTAKSPS